MMTIAVHGLGRMGMQVARKLAESEHRVIAHNRSPEPLQKASGYGAVPGATKQAVIQAFDGQQVVLWLMLPADVVDAQVD